MLPPGLSRPGHDVLYDADNRAIPFGPVLPKIYARYQADPILSEKRCVEHTRVP